MLTLAAIGAVLTTVAVSYAVVRHRCLTAERQLDKGQVSNACGAARPNQATGQRPLRAATRAAQSTPRPRQQGDS